MSAPTAQIPPAMHPISTTPWRLVILLGALTAFAPMSIDMYLPSLQNLQENLRATPGQAQMSVGAFFAGMAIGQFFYGPFSDRFGRRPMILLGISIYIAASIACAMSVSPEMLIGARFVEALGGCAGGVVARAIVRDRFNHQDTARILSLLTMIMGLAPILAPMGGAAISLAGGWRANFVALVVFGILVGGWAFVALKESRSAETALQARSETVIKALGVLLRKRRLVGYALSGALNGAMLFSYISASSDLIQGAYGIKSQFAFSFLFSLNAFGLIGASQVNRFLLRRIPADRILARASLCAVAAALVFFFFAFTGIGGVWTVLPSIFLVLTSYGFIQGNTMAGALNCDPRRAGSISALMGSASFGAGAITSAVAGFFHDGTARPLAVTIVVALSLSSLSIYSLAFTSARTDRS